MITLTTDKYTLVSGKYKLESSKVTEVTEEHYNNYLDSVSFMKSLGGKEKVVKNGNTTVLTSTSPDKSIKVVRTFEVKHD
jgi:hypothetical protein